MSIRDRAQQVDAHSVYVGAWTEATYFTVWWSERAGVRGELIMLDWLYTNLGMRANGRWTSESKLTRTNVVIRDPDDAIWFKMVWG